MSATPIEPKPISDQPSPDLYRRLAQQAQQPQRERVEQCLAV